MVDLQTVLYLMCGYICVLAGYQISYSCYFDALDFGIYTNTRDIFCKVVTLLFCSLQYLTVHLFKPLN